MALGPKGHERTLKATSVIDDMGAGAAVKTQGALLQHHDDTFSMVPEGFLLNEATDGTLVLPYARGRRESSRNVVQPFSLC